MAVLSTMVTMSDLYYVRFDVPGGVPLDEVNTGVQEDPAKT